ncbi:MAG: reverse transcriptase domain-containing protein [Clostridia bacterium]
MQPTTEILASISQNSQAHPDEVFTRLYRYMLRPDIYYLAYKHLYANDGAATPGVNSNDTADGFSEEKIKRIIDCLTSGSYEPLPVRRTDIDKKNGSKKKRPLGLPGFTDKLVQEVMRMILESIYEPIFSPYSHGFRPNRSCHTALKTIKLEFTGLGWFIEGDIKGCFDNIDHQVLTEIIGKKVKDARFIQLVWKFLRAGYMENWKDHTPYSGTPQGGIISPTLANIYLDTLDRYVAEMKERFDKPRDRWDTPEYSKAHYQAQKLSRKAQTAIGQERENLMAQVQAIRKYMRTIPSKPKTDKKLRYVRYADDFLIGISGSKEDCEAIKAELKEFIASKLHMELNDEKTKITHSNDYARFLSYDIRVRRDQTLKRFPGRAPQRTLNGKVEMNIPLKEKIETFLFANGIVVQKQAGKLFAVARKDMFNRTPLEIITTFNAELRGLCNYYRIASNFNSLQYFSYLMEYSCLKTLAAKTDSSLRQTIQKYKDGNGCWGIPYATKQGEKRRYFADYRKCKVAMSDYTDIIANNRIVYNNTRNSLESRLKAKVCELCGSTDAPNYEIHHVHKVKDLKGKEKWEQCMIAKRRKTLVLCKECHHLIHYGHK